MKFLTDIAKGLVSPLANVINKRTARKQAREQALIAVQAAKQQGSLEMELEDREWDAIAASLQDKTWKDEYVTVSIVSVFNFIIIGGHSCGLWLPTDAGRAGQVCLCVDTHRCGCRRADVLRCHGCHRH